MKKRRYAPLLRVSTHQQAKKGESLPVQKKKIIKYVEQLGGQLFEDPWRYSGSEHAAIGFERERFNQLLDDAQKDIYDCVIVTHPDRWSRDNAKSKAGLQILRDNNKKFFIGSEEINLFDEADRLKIGIFTEFAEYQALLQVRKSMESKVERARQNIPTVALPFGRTFDRSKSGQDGWGLDLEKKAKIEHAADRYIKGCGLDTLSREVGIKKTTLWKVLNKRSGAEWKVSFKSQRLNISEEIVYKIPPLLPQKTINAIHLKAKANKTYNCKQRKNRYLLSGMAFCKKCGQMLTGTCSRDYRYYRHPRNHHCKNFYNIQAARIETEVFWHVFNMVGNKTGFEKAVRDSVPDTAKIEKAQNRLSQITFDLKRLSNEKSRILKAIRKGLVDLDDPDLKKDMDNLKSREKVLTDEKSALLLQLKNQPSQKDIENRFDGWNRILKAQFELNQKHLLNMSFEDRRALLQALFDGADHNDKRYGVYVRKDPSNEHPFYYEIVGNLPAIDDKSRIGHDPIGPCNTDEERQHLENTHNMLLAQLSRSLWITYT